MPAHDPSTSTGAPIDDGRCIAIRPNGERCKRRDLAWMNYTAVAKRGDPDGHLCCHHWQVKRAAASRDKAPED